MLCACCANEADSSGELVAKAVLPDQFDEHHYGGDRSSTEFLISLERLKGGRVLGVSFDALDRSALRVAGLAEDVASAGSLVGEYNASAPSNLQLSAGDYIMEVNGIREDIGQMVAELRTKDKLDIVVRRPQEFMVTLQRSRQPLGMFLHYSDESKALVIGEVADGAVKDWNLSRDDKQVLKRDRIVAVNGVSSNVGEMLKALGQEGVQNLLISRPT